MRNFIAGTIVLQSKIGLVSQQPPTLCRRSRDLACLSGAALAPTVTMPVFNKVNFPVCGAAYPRSSVGLTVGRLLRAAKLWERRKAATAGVPQGLDSCCTIGGAGIPLREAPTCSIARELICGTQSAQEP